MGGEYEFLPATATQNDTSRIGSSTLGIAETNIVFLKTSAVTWWEQNKPTLFREQFRLIKEIPDFVIEVFQLQRATTYREGATYQQLLTYFKGLGYTHAQAVSLAQKNIGIPRIVMAEKTEEFQKNIINTSDRGIVQLEEPKPIQTELTKTTGDIARETYNLTTTTTPSPLTQTPKTRELPKETVAQRQQTTTETTQAIIKDQSAQQQTTPQTKESFWSENKDALLVGGILTVSSVVLLTAINVINKKRKK